MNRFQPNENPDLVKVGVISGSFFVPAYQRGYRWGEHEINAMLDDIYIDGQRNSYEKYCLQPIVIKWISDDNRFELIDGQQRLTTLYLIYRYLKNTDPNIHLKFSLDYETRPDSTSYLRDLDPIKKNDNIDFFHIYSAYQLIGDWLQKAASRVNKTPLSVGTRVFDYLQDLVHVIWYDAGEVDSTTLFTRLNVGRIALSNAELIKALLLARQDGNNSADEHRPIEISTQWDMIERELRDEAFWAFLTNKPETAYPTRIEFIFDLIANKTEGEEERFHTFLHFKRLFDCKSLDVQKDKHPQRDIWETVLERYQLLREWFEDRALYHDVGYLVAVDSIELGKLIDVANSTSTCTRTSFRAFLNEQIEKSLDLDFSSAHALSYNSDSKKCERLLLLFNVVSVRELKHSSERYPFHSHKKQNWSLEHIHAQHPEPLNTESAWRSWLDDSKCALTELRLADPTEEKSKQELVSKIDDLLARKKVEKPDFNQLSQSIMEFLTDKDAKHDLHSISNLGLLSGHINSALSNGAFQAKRRRVIKLDRNGEFIPICTRRVFFKYYTDAGSQQMHLWSRKDQASYIDKLLSREEGIGNYLRTVEEAQS
ncbi:DUF262 domain-containing protein [Thiocystis violacea]|uniref:DUF262 domain-containing protein n=1 Tax=Thiocystis violacea TaxID=13725 RepID=UPI001904BE31|nr:DUF262 domain-containing protein [Thiocystis violacea]MBK1719709.1 hypothetical protein [Thiocystis violacea]